MTVNMGSGCSHTQPSPPPQSQKPRATHLPPHPEIHSDQALTQLPLPTVCLQSSVLFSSSRPSWSLGALPQGLCLYFSESESTHSVSCPYPGSNLGSCFPGAPPLPWVTSFLTNSTSVGVPLSHPVPTFLYLVKVEGKVGGRDQDSLEQPVSPTSPVSPSSANVFLPGSL